MRHTRMVLATAFIAAAVLPRPVGASCAAPEVSLTHGEVVAGGDIRIQGRFFIDGCNDVGGTALCGPPAPREPEIPLSDVRLELRRSGDVLDAVTVDADAHGRLGTRLTVPPDAEPGRYQVVSMYWGRVQDRVPVEVVKLTGTDR